MWSGKEPEWGRKRDEKKREGDINLYAMNRGEQLRWPLSCPLHLFGNIISTNQGPAKENGPLDLHLLPSAV